MNKQNDLQQPLHKVSLGKCVLLGAGVALTLIIIFLMGVRDPNPDWGKFWFIRPLIVVSLAGATGGVFYYLLDPLRSQGGWKKIIANIVSLIVYIFGLWIGTVLGLDGTLWN